MEEAEIERKRLEEEAAEHGRLQELEEVERARQLEETEAERKLQEEKEEMRRRQKEEEEAELRHHMELEKKRIEEEEAERHRQDEQNKKEEELQRQLDLEKEKQIEQEETSHLEQEESEPAKNDSATTPAKLDDSIAERLSLAAARPKLQATQRRTVKSNRKRRQRNLNVSALLASTADAAVELPDASKFEELERMTKVVAPQTEPGDGEDQQKKSTFKPPVGAVPMFGMMGMNILAQHSKITGKSGQSDDKEEETSSVQKEEKPKKKLPPGAFNPMAGMMNMQDVLAQRNKLKKTG